MNTRPKHILWLDMEMTGLDVSKDLVLEIAAIVTDWDFNEIATFEGVVKNKTSDLMRRIKANSVFWDANTDSRDALLKQNSSGKTIKQVQDEILAFIDRHFKTGEPVLMAGNSIHMDRRFIVKYLPKFDTKLHYRMLDVSAWKVVFDGKYKIKFAKPDAHRALDDIRGSIIELQYYLTKIK